MKEKQIKDVASCNSIYVICRVFNPGKGDQTGVHFYVDPETKAEDGDLEITPQSWLVTPKRYPYPNN